MPGTIFQVQNGVSLPLFSEMTLQRSQETEILRGECYEFLGREGSFARVRTVLDGYEGFLYAPEHDRQSSASPLSPTHRVDVAKASVYKHPTFKSVARYQLPMNSLVSVEDFISTDEGEMVQIGEGQWVFLGDLCRADEVKEDFVEECLKLRGHPYVWGGRGSLGWDCSSALQAGCIAVGASCERDATPQSRTLGTEVDLDLVLRQPQHGDLIFWTGGKGRHVAVMWGHINAFHFSIAGKRRGVLEPLWDVIEAQERDGNGRPTVARSLPGYRPTVGIARHA